MLADKISQGIEIDVNGPPSQHHRFDGGYSASGGYSGNENFGWTQIPGTVTEMNASYQFTLTARDSASGTSMFQMVPEPVSLFLLGTGALAIFFRRKRYLGSSQR